MNINQLLEETIRRKASDLHITAGVPPMLRIDGNLQPLGEVVLTPEDTRRFIETLLDEKQQFVFNEVGQVDFSYSVSGMGRFRVNAYRQRGSCAAAFRLIPTIIPSLKQLNLPDHLSDFTKHTRGLILVTGPTGSGKSTTLAALIDIINRERQEHIITLEDPIEYLHKHNKDVYKRQLIDILGSDTDQIFDMVELKIEAAKLYLLMEKVLKKRERLILEMRYGLCNGVSKTQREIAKMLGISRSYVSRIEKKAIKKLSKEFQPNSCH